ncbi:MAG: hypothetical protein V4541_13780 [Bacteroidota bacterium]
MQNKKSGILIGVLVMFLLVWMLKGTFTQSGIEDLKGGFTEKATYRNQNNTGPVQRIYVVSVKDTLGAELEAYGNLMPHTKYGNTKVYFFKEGVKIPSKLYPGTINFDTGYNDYCFALYEKSAMGNFGILKNPFK